VAGLPNGANLHSDGCLTINFLDAASEVPAGMSLVVTGITFKPKAVTFGGSACPQETPVCRPGLVLTETGSDQCFASITTGDVPVGSKVKVHIDATVDCTGGEAAACVRYQQLLESDKENTDGQFEVPQPEEPETTPTDEVLPPSETDTPSVSDSDATTSS
jgi:hypothetical protein